MILAQAQAQSNHHHYIPMGPGGHQQVVDIDSIHDDKIQHHLHNTSNSAECFFNV
jgi:hypothetical protein